MSILNVNQIQPVGGGNTITVSASDVSASGATITASSFVGNITGNVTSSSTSEFSSGLNVTGGSIGIGTDNPSAPLHLSGADATNAKIKIEDNNNGFAASEINIANGGRDLRIAAPQDIYFQDVDTGEKHLYIESGGKVGIGTDNPRNGSVGLHIYTGASGQTGTNTANLLIEDSDNVEIGLLCPSTNVARIKFGDNDSANRGQIRYDHTDDSMQFATGANAERLRITSSGNVGIGSNIPAEKLDVNGGLKVYANTNIATFKNNQLRSDAAGTYYFDHGTTGQSFTFRTSTSSSLDTTGPSVTSAGNISFPSGKGIDFSATANSSGTMSSELLDDYEEGTFTPVWGDGSSAYSSPAPTYSTQAGHYTKIGNVVHYDIHLVTTAWNSAGTVMWIYGLPFTTRSSLYQQGGGSTFCIEGVDSQDAISNLTTQIAPNKTNIELYYQTPATGANYNTFGTGNVSEANQVNIRVSGFYYTNS